LFGGSGEAEAGEGGEGINGFKTAGIITEAAGFSFETTEQSIIGVQKLANRFVGSSNKILKAGEVGTVTGVTLGAVNMGLTLADGFINGWENHHAADILVTAAEIGLGLFESTTPVGWILAGGIFIGNLISEHYTGKTITENLFDK
jgi:hypothetical protein